MTKAKLFALMTPCCFPDEEGTMEKRKIAEAVGAAMSSTSKG